MGTSEKAIGVGDCFEAVALNEGRNNHFPKAGDRYRVSSVNDLAAHMDAIGEPRGPRQTGELFRDLRDPLKWRSIASPVVTVTAPASPLAHLFPGGGVEPAELAKMFEGAGLLRQSVATLEGRFGHGGDPKTGTPIDRLHGAAVCSLGLLLHGNEKTDRKAAGVEVADRIDALACAGADLLRYLEVSNRVGVAKDVEIARLREGLAGLKNGILARAGDDDAADVAAKAIDDLLAGKVS